MTNFFDAVESTRKQQQYMNDWVNSSAMQMIRKKQDFIHQVNLLSNSSSIKKITQDYKAWNNHIYRQVNSLKVQLSPAIASINKLNNYKLNFVNKYPDFSKNMYSEVVAITNSLNIKALFDDINLDDLSVFDEILEDIKFDSEPDYKEDSSVLHSALTVNNRGMVRAEMAQAIQSAQSGLSKDMDSKDKIRSFFAGVFLSMGQDVAKYIILAMIQGLVAIIINIAAGNHDYDVAKQVSEKINETETVKTVKKVFVKNPDIEQPIGEMAFLRKESKLRTRPSNKAHLASKEPVSKNTVVFPIETKGNWILVEVETKGDFYIGWIEESKVIKFKLEKNSTNNKD